MDCGWSPASDCARLWGHLDSILGERSQHGPSLLFADVEFLGLIALIAVILGAAVLFAAKKLS